jgi:RNA polymerase sigma factor (sigma-70 family)
MGRSGDAQLSNILSRLALSKADTEAWKLLYQRMWPFVIGLNFRLLGGAKQAADDASQEVFLRLLQYSNFESLTNPDSFRKYLRTVCTNVSRDFLQKLARRNETGLDGVQIDSLRSDVPGPQDVQAKEMYEGVLGQLSADDRRMIEWAAEGYTLDEIAEAAGLSYSNAGVRLHRIRGKLRNALLALRIRRRPK